MSSPEACREQGFFGGSLWPRPLPSHHGCPLRRGPEPGSSGPSAPWLEPPLAQNSGAVV